MSLENSGVRAGEPLVVVDHVVKHYGDFVALNDVSLTVDKGEVVVLIGPSGSGKSTLCRTINRLETITSGDIRIDGESLPQEGRKLAALRAEVGMVFQSFNLFSHKTILDNVTLAPVKVKRMPKKEAEDLAHTLLECSPPAWGWSGQGQEPVPGEGVFPTRVGMAPSSER